MPRIALVAGPLLALGAARAYVHYTRPYQVPIGTDVFAVVQGTWAWTTSDTNCAKNPHTITFTPDHKGMLITASHPNHRPDGRLDSVAFYDIRAYTRSSIRGAIRGERRLTDEGRPVVWDLVLKSPDRYVWHRTDWAPEGYTREIRRCSGGQFQRR
jgi:hypothetical protein